jgi:ATP:ADP antiporter, AAA family
MLVAEPLVTTPTVLERLLRPFSKVRPGEGLQAVLLLACVFLILTSYYMMKTAREGLILTTRVFGLRGEELKSYAGGAMALLLIGIVPAYGALARRVRRIWLINVSYAIVIACLLAFFGLGTAGVPIGLPFFIWIGLVNMFLIAQFWSYATDLYTEEQGKRLFAIIALGGSIGAIVGPKLTTFSSTYTLMPLAAALLVACIAMFNLIERIHVRGADPGDKTATETIEGKGAFALVLQNRYLLLMAALVFVAELVKTNGEFILSSSAAEHAAQLIPSTAHPDLVGAVHDAAITADRREVIKDFYGVFFFWVNLVGFVIQAFLVSRVIDKLGVRRSLFIMPIIALGTYGAIGMIGGLALVRAAKTAENATEYSMQNTVRQTLFLPTDRATKYKAKAAIDTFVVRFGDSLSALLVWVGVHEIGMRVRGLAFVNVGLVAVWIVIAIGIAREHKKISKDKPTAEATAA